MLAVHADLALEIDGQPATLTGTGRRLVLELASARLLRTMFDVALPRLDDSGWRRRNLPALLTRQSLTMEIRDRRGPLLVVGKEAEGRRLRLPGIGRIDDAKLGSRTALLRMALGR